MDEKEKMIQLAMYSFEEKERHTKEMEPSSSRRKKHKKKRDKKRILMKRKTST